jgi:hypothetical protein
VTHPGHTEGGQMAARRFNAQRNATVQRKARAKLSELELSTGHSPEWWAAWHRSEREAVRSGARRAA